MTQTAQQKEFSFALTPLEKRLLRKFQTLLFTEQKKTFTSDDFRLYGLDKHFTNPQAQVGCFFARAVHHKLIRHTGRWVRSVLPQNNMRKIKEYEWTIR